MPTYIPIQPHRHLNISSNLSTRKAHFRRLYDVYHLALQKDNPIQARRAYSLLVRCREFDWAANWRSGLEMVHLSDEDEYNDDNELQRQKRLLQLKVDYLRECHIVHSRVARKKHSLREVGSSSSLLWSLLQADFSSIHQPEEILLQLVLLLATNKRHIEALNELEL
jgi:hypothetical protein